MREDEAQRALGTTHELRYDRLEVVAIGSESMQPDDGSLRIAARLDLYALTRHGGLLCGWHSGAAC